MIARILLVASDVFVRRLTPALASFVRMQADFRILDISRSPSDLRREIRMLNPRGLIIEALPKRTDMLVGLGLPTVIADSDAVFPGAVSMDVNDDAVGSEAARFFINSGYAHFGCVRNSSPYSDQRFNGFAAAVAGRAGTFSAFQQSGRMRPYMETWNEDTAALTRWLKQLPKPVAVFAVHDPLGRLVCEAAVAAGMHVPEEVAVVGANNDELVCGLSYPPLSSMIIPWNRLGNLAGDWVLRLIAGEQAPQHALMVEPGPVNARQSTTLVAVDDTDLRRVIQFMREHFSENVGIGDLCDRLRISRRAVERKCGLYLHASPWEVLSRMRVDAAREHLARTDRPMGDIAERCGFANAEQFSVIFRKFTGQTPSGFRKSSRG